MMGELQSGDKVLTVDAATGTTRFEHVYLFGHRDPAVQVNNMVTLHLDVNKSLTLTPDHFVPVLRTHGAWWQRVMKRAKDVEVGEFVFAVDAVNGSVVGAQVSSVAQNVSAAGMYNPFTRAGLIVVDGVIASEYSEWIFDGVLPARWIPAAYHMIQMPLARLIYPVAPEVLGALSEHLSFGWHGWPAFLRAFSSAVRVHLLST